MSLVRIDRGPAAPQRIQSIQRAFELLRALAEAGRPETVPELARSCGLNRSTAWRILATLEHEGAVERDPATNRYTVGYAVAQLAAAAGHDAFVRRAHPHLRRLADEVGETVSLAIPSRLNLVYVDQVQARHVMAADWLGRATPLHATATGKAFLAALPADELNAALSQPLEKFTDRTIVKAESLRSDLAAVRRRGYAVSRGELEVGLWGVAAAIIDRGRPAAVISVWGSESHVRQHGAETLGALTMDTAQAIAAAIQTHTIAA